jgi:hypothetical protein
MKNFNYRFNGIDHDAWEFEYDGVTCLCYFVTQHGTSWWVARVGGFSGFGKSVLIAARQAFRRYWDRGL